MQKSILSLALLACFACLAAETAAQTSDLPGFKEVTLPDKSSDHPLHVNLWYPIAKPGPGETLVENKV